MSIIVKLSKKSNISKIEGWFVSLFALESLIFESQKSLKLLSGDQLIQILGSELYNKLKDVKLSFSTDN